MRFNPQVPAGIFRSFSAAIRVGLDHSVAFLKKTCRNPQRMRWAGIAAVCLIVLLAVGVAVSARIRVTVICDGQETQIRMWGYRVEKALVAAGVKLEPHDETVPAIGSVLKNEMTVEVIRAVNVTITVDSRQHPVTVTPRAPRGVLEYAGITLGDDDRIIPDNGEPVKDGGTIRVVRVKYAETTEKVIVPFKIESKPDPNMQKGDTRVLEPGKKGIKEQHIRLTYEDGQLKRRTVLDETIIEEPRKQVVAVGTKTAVFALVTSRGTYQYNRMLEMTATAYYPGPESCGPNAKGITRSGIKAGYGVVAVDPKVIPLGTRLYVEGYGPALAADTGSAIKGNKIDLCFETYQEAIRYGKKKIKVYILVQA